MPGSWKQSVALPSVWTLGIVLLVGIPVLYNTYRGVLPMYHGWPHGALPHPNDMTFHSALTQRIVV